MTGVPDFLPALLAFLGGVGAGVCFARRRVLGGEVSPGGKPPFPVSVTVAAATPAPQSGLIALAGALREIVLVLDKDDRLVYFNESARVLPGVADDALGRDAAVIIRSADFLECLRRVRAGISTPGASEVLVRRTQGASDLALEVEFSLLPETVKFGPGSLAVVMSDVSRLRRLEGVRREFVANVSHDLRTPVTIVKGYALTLIEDYETMSDEDRMRFLEKIRRNTNRLHVLLEDLLELSSLEDSGSAALSAKSGSLHAVLRDCAEALSDRLAAAGMKVEWSLGADDARVATDSPKMSRLAQNLLENAMRYGLGASRVLISTTIDGDKFVLRFEDDGPGVAQLEYEKVFGRFYRAEKSRSTAGGGSGLGLSIVKHIVLAHGGEVRAEPARPKGFAVVIELPLIPAA